MRPSERVGATGQTRVAELLRKAEAVRAVLERGGVGRRGVVSFYF